MASFSVPLQQCVLSWHLQRVVEVTAQCLGLGSWWSLKWMSASIFLEWWWNLQEVRPRHRSSVTGLCMPLKRLWDLSPLSVSQKWSELFSQRDLKETFRLQVLCHGDSKPTNSWASHILHIWQKSQHIFHWRASAKARNLMGWICEPLILIQHYAAWLVLGISQLPSLKVLIFPPTLSGCMILGYLCFVLLLSKYWLWKHQTPAYPSEVSFVCF